MNPCGISYNSGNLLSCSSIITNNYRLMRIFVTQPKTRRQKPKQRMIVRTESKKNSRSKLFFFYYRKYIVSILIIWIITYFLFYHTRNPIKHVVFSQETYEQLSYTEAFDTISGSLVGKEYMKQKYLRRSNFEREVSGNYPIINSIEINSFHNWTLNLTVNYNAPDFLMKSENGVQWIVYKDRILAQNSWNALWTSWIHINIALPEDILITYSWGVFQKTPSRNIARTIKQVWFIDWFSSVTYYPWWEKLEMKTDKDTFIIWLEPSKLKKTFEERENVIPYLPTEIPAKIDLSNPDRIIIQH